MLRPINRAHKVRYRCAVAPPTGIREVDEVLARVAMFEDTREASARVLSGGLTNTNYLLEADGDAFVVRVSTANTAILGIDRAREAAALRRASEAGIAPETVAFLLPEGHSVTRFLTDAKPFTSDEFSRPETVRRVAARLADSHSLGSVIGTFDPYADIRRWLATTDERGVARPDRLGAVLELVMPTKDRRAASGDGQVLCHNDPYYLNVLDDGDLWFLDWEYAGMGDPMFDLAGVAYALDDTGRDILLEAYFGEVTDTHRSDLRDMIRVFLAWNVAWSLMQITSRSDDPGYRRFAEGLLDITPTGPATAD